MFAIDEHDKQTYRKLGLNARNTVLVNQYLADSQNSQMNEKEKLVAADDIYLNKIDDKYHSLIRDIFRNHKITWNRRLGNTIVAKFLIDLEDSSKMFKLAFYRFRPTTR